MATTLQDLQAKRKELQATNPNATMLDAKSAISPIQNAPIAWQAPAIAPVAPTPAETPMNVNQKVLADNQAKVQSEIAAWTRPEVWTKATPEQTPAIIQQAQTQTAQANKETPTAPVAPAETATTQTENKSSNPISTTSNVSNQQVVTPDSNSIYTSLRSNVPVADITKNTQAYKDAQARYNNFQKYASYDINTLTTALSNGSILPWTSTWNDLMTDPVMWGKILQAKALTNWKWADYTSTTQNVSDTIVSNSPVVSGMLADWQITAEEWASATNTPEVTAKMADVETKKNEYDTLKAKYDAVEDDVKAEYANRDVRWSFLDAVVADRRKSMFKELTIAWDTYNNALGTLTQLKTDASNLFETNMKLYQDQKAQENQYKMAQYQAQLGLATNQAKLQQEADFAKKQAQENLNDPAIAIENVMNEYKKLGIPFTSTVQSRLQEFASSWLSLPDYLTQMTESIQASPAYQNYKSLQEWQMSDVQKMNAQQNFEMKKMWIEQDFQMTLANAKNVTNNKWTKLDDWLYTNENWDIITQDELKTSKLIDNSYLQKQVGEEGGECWVFASRGVGMSSTPWGNSKEARVKAFADKTPQVWGMAFFGWAWYDPTYWHISIVTSVNEDWTINVKDSNYNGDKKVTERTVPASTATGFYNNTPLANGLSGQAQGSQTGWQYSDEQINNLAYLVELQEKNPSEASKQMKEMGYKAQDMANYKAGNMPLTEKQKNSSIDVMDAIKQLADPTKYEWNDAVGFLAWTPSLSGWDAATATMAIDNLVAKLTLPNLWVLKWPMSDKDIAFIKDASSKLSRDQSDASFEKNLIDAYNLSARRAWMPDIKSLAELQGNAQETVGGEKSYSKYE